MSFRRVGWAAAVALAIWLLPSCGEVFRPVVIPLNITPPNSANFHSVFGISANVPFTPGTAMQIDVSGDTAIGQGNMGVNPTHAAILPNNSEVFVASAGSLFTGNTDAVTAFLPARDSSIATGLISVSAFTYPNVGAVNPVTGKPFTCSYLPDYVATAQNNAVFVANYGVENDPNCDFASTDSVSLLNPALSTISMIKYLPAGSHPIAMVETSDTVNLYVLNQGTNSVADLSPQDLSTTATIPVGNTPAWAALRPDNQRLYVVTQGDGQLYTIRTDTNAVISGSPQSVGGAGANYVLYDNILNRLYVTNPNAGAVYIFDATTDPPKPIGSVTGALSIPAPAIPANTAPCAGGGCSYSSVMPVSVAALPDATRFYVASFVISTGSACPDPNVSAAGCVIPQVTVFDSRTLAVKTNVFPLLSPITATSGSTVQPFALAPLSFCSAAGAYTPASARFRMSAAVAPDSTRVYASMCDAGAVAIIKTVPNTIATGDNTPDTLVTALPTPFGAGPPQSNNQPATQSPVFVLTGP